MNSTVTRKCAWNYTVTANKKEVQIEFNSNKEVHIEFCSNGK